VGKASLAAEFLQFLMHRKKWWLIPLVMTLLLMGLVIIFTEGSALAPFIYALF
jgi:hypothetical protein